MRVEGVGCSTSIAATESLGMRREVQKCNTVGARLPVTCPPRGRFRLVSERGSDAG